MKNMNVMMTAKCRAYMWRVEPTTVPLFAGLRHMEEDVFLKNLFIHA